MPLPLAKPANIVEEAKKDAAAEAKKKEAGAADRAGQAREWRQKAGPPGPRPGSSRPRAVRHMTAEGRRPGRRNLSDDERTLWREVTRSVRPLRRPGSNPRHAAGRGRCAQRPLRRPEARNIGARRMRRGRSRTASPSPRPALRRSSGGRRRSSPAAPSRSTRGSTCTAARRARRTPRCCSSCGARRATARATCW